MNNDVLLDWIHRTTSDYNALVEAMDNARLGPYDPIRQCASFMKNNLDELAKQLQPPVS